MSNNLATESSRQQAVDAVRCQKRPSGVSAQRWRSIMKLLRVVARHYPNCHPSVTTLAAEMKCSRRMAQYRIEWAVAAGVLVVEYDAGCSRKGRINKTSRYHIASLQPDCTRARSGDDIAQESTPSEYPLPTVVGPLSGSPRYARPQSAAMSREAEEIVREGEARVVKAKGQLRQERPVFQTKPRKNDARVLREYFQLEWQNLLAKKPLLASNNALDRTGETEGYIWSQFLRPEYAVAYTGEQVMEMIDAFFLDLASGRISLKQRQSAWKAFTVYKQPPKPKTNRENLSDRNRRRSTATSRSDS